MNHTHSDCRDQNGITIGLIDAIITLSRLLVIRELNTPEVEEALKDLAADEDFNKLVEISGTVQDRGRGELTHPI